MSLKSYIAVGLQILGYKDIIKEQSLEKHINHICLEKYIKHIYFRVKVIKYNVISKETLFFYFYNS